MPTVRPARSIPSLVLCALLAAPAGVAGAQPAPGAPLARPERNGLLLGFGVHAGHMSCSSDGDVCDGVSEAGGVDFHIGTMLRPRLAVVGEIWPMAHTEDNVTITHVISTVGLQYWLAPGLWVRGGVGAAYARFTYAHIIALSDDTETVAAVMAAAGYEILAGRRFTMDLQLRGGTGFYRERGVEASNAGIALGFTWY
jgi:hypothetical protein